MTREQLEKKLAEFEAGKLDPKNAHLLDKINAAIAKINLILGN